MALSEPLYLLPSPTASFLSDTRPTRLAPASLVALNCLLDELLQAMVHSALSLAPSSPLASPYGTAGPLSPAEVFTTDRFKSAVIRTVGPRLGQIAVLEGGVAIQEWLRLSPPSMRGHPALKSSAMDSMGNGGGESADAVFASLRAWVMAISRLGAASPPAGPASLFQHLQILTPPSSPPPPVSLHLSFPLALYAEHCLTAIAERIVSLVGRVTERHSGIEVASLEEVAAALSEDDLVFTWYSGMRVRGRIENDLERSRARREGSVNGGSQTASPLIIRRESLKGATSPGGIGSKDGMRTSHDSLASQNGLNYRSASQEGSAAGTGLGISNESELLSAGFEELIQSGKTMKVSLTPDRLKAMELLERARSRVGGTPASPTLPSVAGATPSSLPTSNSTRRLKARAAALGPGMIDEDDEEDEDDAGDLRPGAKRRPKETLLEILNSPPPGWDEPEPDFAPTVAASIPMSTQLSADSAMTMSSGVSNSSEAFDVWANASPNTRKKALRPKDEREDLAFERQVNSDLVEFFASPPPGLVEEQKSPVIRKDLPPMAREKDSSGPYDPFAADEPRKKKGLRSFFSKGIKTKDESSPTASSPSIPSPSSSPVDGPRNAATRTLMNAPLRKASGNSDTSRQRLTDHRGSPVQASQVPLPKTNLPLIPRATSEPTSDVNLARTRALPSNRAATPGTSSPLPLPPSPTSTDLPLPSPEAKDMRKSASGRSIAASDTAPTVSEPQVLFPSSAKLLDDTNEFVDGVAKQSLVVETVIPTLISTPATPPQDFVPFEHSRSTSIPQAVVVSAAPVVEEEPKPVRPPPALRISTSTLKRVPPPSVSIELEEPGAEEESQEAHIPRPPPTIERACDASLTVAAVADEQQSSKSDPTLECELRDLRDRMATVTTVEECLGMVDVLLGLRFYKGSGFNGSTVRNTNEEAALTVSVSPAVSLLLGKPQEEKSARSEGLDQHFSAATRDQSEYDELFQASLVEYFLGDPPYSTPSPPPSSSTVEVPAAITLADDVMPGDTSPVTVAEPSLLSPKQHADSPLETASERAASEMAAPNYEHSNGDYPSVAPVIFDDLNVDQELDDHAALPPGAFSPFQAERLLHTLSS